LIATPHLETFILEVLGMLETTREALADEREKIREKIADTKAFQKSVREGEGRFVQLSDGEDPNWNCFLVRREQMIAKEVRRSFLDREELNEDRIVLEWVRDLDLWEIAWDIQNYVRSFVMDMERLVKSQIDCLFR
jgi:hypothetical protein